MNYESIISINTTLLSILLPFSVALYVFIRTYGKNDTLIIFSRVNGLSIILLVTSLLISFYRNFSTELRGLFDVLLFYSIFVVIFIFIGFGIYLIISGYGKRKYPLV